MSSPIAVTIAGSDPSGGAGVQADLKTFAALGVYGASILTALTAQNTQGVEAVHTPPCDFITAQMKSVFTDLNVSTVKIGMLANGDIVEAVAKGLEAYYSGPIVLDPVMVATSGDMLLDRQAQDILTSALIPRANLITPNLNESAALLGQSVASSYNDMYEQSIQLMALKPKAVLLKGGHQTWRDSTSQDGAMKAVDLFYDGQDVIKFEAPYIQTKNIHGTGCTLSSAIAAFLARGETLQQAVGSAKAYITQAIKYADHLDVGSGSGPVCHHFEMYKT